MMRIAVIDCRDSRRNAVAGYLKMLNLPGELIQVFAYNWTREHLRDENASGCDCLFLHVGATDQPDVWEALSTHYKDACAICYSGGYEIEGQARKHQADNPRHIWYGRISSANETLPTSVREDFSQFLTALVTSSKFELAVGTLKRIDWVLESKLNILHLAMSGVDPNDLMMLEDWGHLADFDEEHGSQFRALAAAGDIRRLRDYLLPEHEFIEAQL